MTRSTRLLWLLHVVANAVFAYLVWVWLGIPDARTWQLGVTVVLGLAILIGMSWLHGSTFRYFGDTPQPLAAAFRNGLRRIPVFAVWAAVFVACIVLLQRWQPKGSSTGVLRWFVAWVLVPAILLPIAAALMGEGRKALAVYRAPKYWVWAVVLLTIGVYGPYRLIGWTPAVKGFGVEMTSFILRWLVAYLGLVIAWLMLAYVSSGGSPRLSQPNTDSLPDTRMQAPTSA